MVFVCASKRFLICCSDDSTESVLEDEGAAAGAGVGAAVDVGDAMGGLDARGVG